MLIGAIGNDPDSAILELGAAKDFVPDKDGRLFLTPIAGLTQTHADHSQYKSNGSVT
jgi:hypothetical protein